VIRYHYRKNLRNAVGSSAAPYGYTVATWTTGAVLAHAHGIPDTLAALTFMAGAVLGFAFVGALPFGGLTRHYDQDSGQAVLWVSFHFLSVGLSIGAAALVAHYVDALLSGPWRPSCPLLPTFSSWEPSQPSPTCGTTGKSLEDRQRLMLPVAGSAPAKATRRPEGRRA